MKKARGIKIGVIGIGTMGKHHARVCHVLPGINFLAIADIDQESTKALARQYQIQAFNDYKEMLALIDAVIIASPTQTHFEIAQTCLLAHKNILVEKPLALNSESAKKLKDLSNSKNLILAVGMVERFNPAFVELSKLTKKEKILGVHIKRFSPFPERITDANVIQDMMVHDLDLLASLLPHDEIESIKAEGKKVKSDKLDKVSATIFFKSGTLAKVEADRIFGIKTRKITVTTERGLIEADLLNKRVYVRDLEHHIPSVHHTKKTDQLTEELKDFFKAIKNNHPPKVTAEDGYQVLKLAEEVEAVCS